jgi:hypothetical protein
MDASETAAGDRLRLRTADAQTWMLRIGYPSIRRFGAGRARERLFFGKGKWWKGK